MRIIRSTLTLASLFFAGCVESSILLDVNPGERRCISDSVRAGSDITVGYRVPKGSLEKGMMVKITQPFGRDLVDDMKADWAETLIKPAEKGDGGTYNVCFLNTNPEEKSRVEIREDKMAPKQGANPQTAQHLQKVDGLLLNAKTVASSLKEQMKETATSEGKGSMEDEKLRSRIITGSCFTIVVVVGASAWQLILLNKFFRATKQLDCYIMVSANNCFE